MFVNVNVNVHFLDISKNYLDLYMYIKKAFSRAAKRLITQIHGKM